MNSGRIVVSGAHGFIGSHLVEHLRHLFGPDRVFSLIREKTHGSRQTIQCDLLDSRKLARILTRVRPSLFFHAAGGSRGTFEELINGNIFTTLTLFRTLSEIKLPMRVVVLGSAAEYGVTNARSSASRTPLRPETPYAWTKACQTLLAEQVARTGFDVVIARLFNFTGPGVPPRLAVGSFAQKIANAERSGAHPVETGNLNPCRDLIDIRDAVSAIVRIAQKGERGAVYDVCSGSSLPMRRILDMLLQHARMRLRIRTALGRHNQIGDIPFSRGDPGPLKRLGWKPSISLKISLLDTLNYYRSQN